MVIFSAQEFDDACFGTADDGFVFFDENGALEKLFVLHKDIDDRFGIVHEVVGVEFEFFELGILADKVFNGILKKFDNAGERGFIGRSFDVENDLVIDSKFLGDRQGIA